MKGELQTLGNVNHFGKSKNPACEVMFFKMGGVCVGLSIWGLGLRWSFLQKFPPRPADFGYNSVKKTSNPQLGIILAQRNTSGINE